MRYVSYCSVVAGDWWALAALLLLILHERRLLIPITVPMTACGVETWRSYRAAVLWG